MKKTDSDVAVIGMSGRFPGARSISDFWINLCNGEESICSLSDEQLRDAGISDTELGDSQYVKRAPLLNAFDRFDPGFFRISPAEAELLDPQIRLLLQCAWETLEDAGYCPGEPRNIGVFAGAGGIATSYYANFVNLCERFEKVTAGAAHLANDKDFLSTYVSYRLNLTGPSVTVQTACSTSLVALHQACGSVLNDECEMALAGGVTVRVPHVAGYAHKEGHIVSKSGYVRTFDERADGTVFGSGLGLVLVKKLDAAIRDEDPVYCVIKGSAITNDGKGKLSYAASSARGQIECITQALNRAGVDAGSVGFVETHGTGTYLGDPEEVKALTAAFKQHTKKKGYCALGAVKTNVGHLEAAAGITGFIKAALTLYYGWIPPTLHFERPNPRIKFDRTPFFVNNTLVSWTQERQPRRAAVNSLGVGGTNAFVVLEAHDGVAPSRPRQNDGPVIVPLSAQTPEALARYAQALGHAISPPDPVVSAMVLPVDLANLAYTLQVGRQAMECRVAFVVPSLDELGSALTAYRTDPDVDARPDIVRPVVDAAQDEVPQATLTRWIEARQLEKLAELWVNGREFDWQRLYSDARPRRISLPTYPFARERHWLDSEPSAPEPSKLHPLLHSNTSSLAQQSYRSLFTGDEFFLRDHRIRIATADDGCAIPRKVLPGVAYLEMARAAIESASGPATQDRALQLRDIVWIQPIVVTQRKEVGIALFADEGSDPDEEAVDFEIYSTEPDAQNERREILHCQGKAAYVRPADADRVDISRLGAQMTQYELGSEALYDAFENAGLSYGPAHRGIERIRLGERQLLAELKLPAAVESSRGAYQLHPSLMDGALQSTLALLFDGGQAPDQPVVPFAMERLTLRSSCTREMFAWVRNSRASEPQIHLIKTDIDLYDRDGRLYVRIEGLCSRVLENDLRNDLVPAAPTGVLLATPRWLPATTSSSTDEPASPARLTADKLIILVGLPDIDVEALQRRYPRSAWLRLLPDGTKSIADQYSEVALGCFRRLQALFNANPQRATLVQVVVAGQQAGAIYAGLSGLLKTASLENPLVTGQIILTDAVTGEQELFATLAENEQRPRDAIVKYEQGVRHRLAWEKVPPEDAVGLFRQERMPLKDDGVYVITGGLGGLGRLFAAEILGRTSRARVILTGRSSLTGVPRSDESRGHLESLRGEGRAVEYRELDLMDQDAVTRFMQALEHDYASVDGILHCAGMTDDGFILRKTAECFQRVLSPKVAGTFHLDQASRDCRLDFFVLFSSLTSAIGNLGQADYAAANGFMDYFAALRDRKVAAGERRGRTLAVHWPLWRDGGMGQDAANRAQLRRSAGIEPMQTDTGLRLFYRSLLLPHDRTLVMEGDPQQIEQALFDSDAPADYGSVSGDAPCADAALPEQTEAYLCNELSRLLKVPAHKIDPKAPLERYGIDSILAIDLTDKLEKTFGALPKTLFFEYQTIHALTDYFVGAHAPRLAGLFSPQRSAETPAPAVRRADARGPGRVSARRFGRNRARGGGAEPTAPRAVAPAEPIAIVGLSGRYPLASDIDAYWANLRDGRDCITEVPESRWNWRDYYSDDRTVDGSHYSKWGGFIDGVDEFDPLFFNISPREAAQIDPQERLFLQQAWMAVEDAGLTRSSLQIPDAQDLPGQVGVYVGVMYGEYQLLGAEASLQGRRMGFASNLASIANRVSYVLNLHGPSMTVDTMCSSSLTAIHLACQDLKQGNTSLAIAGGVNITIHPNKYLMLSSGQFISSAGQCQSFGEGGDGYIPAEGVGAVVLKRLSEAQRDGHHIYGIIIGSALGHGGKTNGYTVPNPQAQADAIARALREAGTRPRHISYVEAHGTGTKLGDPIEIAALSRAFDQDGQPQEHGLCAIGSVKSNIGHCESAAGIAGLTKVLLQMRHQQIVPSLHSTRLNPHIDFAQSPFQVNQTLKRWEQPVVDGRQLPRIAGISSFGAGGSNAHLIVQEYPPRPVQTSQGGVVIVPLSARTREQLERRARDLLAFLDPPTDRALTQIDQARELKALDLASMAYTLQVGREAMGERLSLIVDSPEQLADRLCAFLDGVEDLEDVYRGQARSNQETLSLLAADTDFLDTIGKWFAGGKLAKLANLWARGFELDWRRLYEGCPPAVMSLPTYPFSRERHWVDGADGVVAAPADSRSELVGHLHPLVHSNTSNLDEQRYSSSFCGQERTLAGRRLNGQALFPPAAYLEMVGAALRQAVADGRASDGIVIKQLVAAGPVDLDAVPVHLAISLLPGSDGEIGFEIYSDSRGTDPWVHCQGNAAFLDSAPNRPERVLDLDGIRRRTGRAELTADRCYRTFARHGVTFDRNFQAIAEIHQGDGELLARLELPREAVADDDGLQLHPVLLDAAIQSAVALITSAATEGGESVKRLVLPFGVDRAEILGATTRQMYAWVRYAAGTDRADEIARLDIDLGDTAGKLVAKLTGIVFDCAFEDAAPGPSRRPVVLDKAWQAAPIPVLTQDKPGAIILHDGDTEALARNIAQRCNSALLLDSFRIDPQWPNALQTTDTLIDLTGIGPRRATGDEFADCISLLQELVEAKRSGPLRLLFVTRGLEAFANDAVQLNGADRVGLYRMLQSEYPAITSRHVDLDPTQRDIEAQSGWIGQELAADSREVEVCYRQGQRYRSELRESALAAGQRGRTVNASGVLLVTGGTRGLGLACAKHCVERYGIRKLVLTGRASLPPESQWDDIDALPSATREKIRNIRELRAAGVEVLTLPFPLDDLGQLAAQYRTIRQRLGRVTAVIHAAGLTDDENPAFIRKPVRNIAQVTAPKVAGLQNLMGVLKGEPLDFVLLFSSASATIPALGAGQSDYVMANAYMDYYAAAHAASLPIVSIQWPSWRETGMGEVANRAYQDTGLLSVSNQEGFDALDRILAGDLLRPVVMPLVVDPAGLEPSRLMRADTPQAATPQRPNPNPDAGAKPAAGGPNDSEAANAVETWLQTLVETELRMDAGTLDIGTPFPDYGVDSVLLAQILAKINAALGLQVDPSILLEYASVSALSRWLQREHRDTVARALGAAPQLEPEAVADPVAVADIGSASVRWPATSRRLKSRRGNGARRRGAVRDERIAVVGLSCRFPGADDVQAYWDLLAEGRSAIAPVPVDCWGVETDFHAGLLDEIYGFDPGYFMIPPEDARVMDPQALVLLEESLNAVYHAGYTEKQLNGRSVGVYIGARSQNRVDSTTLAGAHNPIVAVGQNYLAANLAQFYNVNGPALVLDTACSSALVAMRMAVEAMRGGAIESALVGGVSLLTSPLAHEVFASRNLHAADGVFHIFDQRASGVVIGEGCGMVYLKPLSAAERDGDTVYAEIAGVGINNDGRTAGPATPNIDAQKAVMRAALAQTGCSIADVDYLEVNGSGSEVTDLLEMKAIADVYDSARRPAAQTSLYLGSMKPNIGHPLCAEGIAGFIKLVLMLQRQRLVPFLSGQRPLRHFPLDGSGLGYPRQAQPAQLNYVAMNSFADGGTNAHLILKRAARDTARTERAPLPRPAMQRIDVRTQRPLPARQPSEPGPGLAARLTHRLAAENVWGGDLSAANPVLANHKVYGRSLLPGLAWIDVLYQWFVEVGYAVNELELRNLAIYRPLQVDDNARVALAIEAERVQREQVGVFWQVRVGDVASAGRRDGLYITAEMHPCDAVRFEERIDKAVIGANAQQSKDLAEIYRAYRARELVHTGSMCAQGRVYTGPQATWIHLEAEGQEGRHLFHPTLIDGSAIGTADLFPHRLGTDEPLFLPIYYESFRASGALANECYTRIDHGDVTQSEELQCFTMAFFDRQGDKVAELKNFRNKRVRHAGLIDAGRGEAGENAVKKASPQPLADIPFDSMEGMLQALIAAHLGIEAGEVATDRGYYELGLQSVMLLELVESIETLLLASLSPLLLFEYTNIAALAGYLLEHHRLPERGGVPALPVRAPAAVPERRSAVRIGQPGSATGSTTHLPYAGSEGRDGASPQTLDIAVVGMAGRYPQAADLEQFWENLKAGKDCITEVPATRWAPDALDGMRSASGRPMSRWGGFIDDFDCFDPLFFNVSPKEAEVIDPQERLFLEICWAAMEDAGYTLQNIVPADQDGQRRRVGVFVGVMHKDYSLVQSDAANRGEDIPLSLNFAGIANRVSYFCDFRGPSMAVDTACSSSLTALHLAMESIIKGECQLAFAGGVNLSLHPHKYQSYGLIDMHASDGRCHSFGAGGDGYVSAEGVGVVLIKPLQRALDDGDSIYAVLKGSTLNHVGRVSGITVPSPVAQGDMIADCLAKCRIDPESISYIEAHGTGTSLGDPIEIEGLNRAYRALTSRKQFCALGSVKSNIGHAESAAGISGLTKVILQLQHRTRVASLHSEQINPYLDLNDSPFYVQRRTEPWDSPEGVPRRAGISSFGATGSNVHVIVEEFRTEQAQPRTEGALAVLLPLSAQNRDRLNEYVGRLIRFLRARPDTDLHSLAYTLQTGRAAHQERLIVQATSIDDACEKLANWHSTQRDGGGIWQQRVKRGDAVNAVFDADDDLQQALSRLVAKGKFDSVAQLWVQGVSIDWQQIYAAELPQRIHLPTYPFARERFWVSRSRAAGDRSRTRVGAVAALHPLLHSNTSDLTRQSYRSTFSGEEFFLRDHLVQDKKVLPAVAYLEMALVACRDASPAARAAVGLRLRNLTWAQPCEATGASLSLVLHADAASALRFEFIDEGAAQEPSRLYCRGEAVIEPSAQSVRCDIDQLRSGLHGGDLEPAELYAAYRRMGIAHGPAMQGIVAIRRGDNELLVELALPDAPPGDMGDAAYLLHPVLMDSALQATLGLWLGAQRVPDSPLLPFALASLRFVAPTGNRMFARVRYAGDAPAAPGRTPGFDIDLYDEQGHLSVEIRGLSARSGAPAQPSASAASSTDLVAKPPVEAQLCSFAPVWTPVAAEPATHPAADTGTIVLLGSAAALAWLQQSFPGARRLEIPPGADIDQIAALLRDARVERLAWVAPDMNAQERETGIIEQQASGTLALFRLIKALFQAGYGHQPLQWTLITRQTLAVGEDYVIRAAHAGVAGLIGSLAKEYPHWRLRLLDLVSLDAASARDCFALPFNGEGNGLAHRDGEWFRQGLALLQEQESDPTPSRYRERGVYIVIGGAGGLGEAWTRYVVEHYRARAVWIGRRGIDSDIEAKIANVARLGDAPLYISADATDRQVLARARERILTHYPCINGVVHSAIVLQDQSITRMDEATFAASLAAKVDSSVNVDRVFGADRLDFMLFFSSINSFVKGAGQCNYAAGCTFQDSYAGALDRSRDYPVKVVNWGFWGSIGVVADATYRARMAQMGIGSIEVDEGMAALQQLLSSARRQVAVIKRFPATPIANLDVTGTITRYRRAAAVLPEVANSLPETLAGAVLAPQRLSELGLLLPDADLLDLTAQLLRATLYNLGLLRAGKAQIADLAPERVPAPYYSHWLHHSIDYLQRSGLLDRDLIPVGELRSLDALWAEWEQLRAGRSGNDYLRAELGLVEVCLKALPDILRAGVPATDVMFPGSSMARVEGIYKNNAIADFYNEILAETLVAAIAAQVSRDPAGEIRILEIGAGTGGTTARLLPHLQPYAASIAEYCYSDLSQAFLRHAREHYQPQFPALTTAIFNVSQPLEGQGIEAGRYDFVIATNVLHATPDIRETLRNAKAALRAGGILLINEISTWKLFNHLTFGLLEGWWLHADSALRLPGNPGLAPGKWQVLLQQEGFESLCFPAEPAHHLGQQVIAAASNGEVRQRWVEASPVASVPHSAPEPRPAAPRDTQPVSPEGPHWEVTDEMLENYVVDSLRACIGDAIKMASEAIEADRSFAEYGVDSIIAVQLINRINQRLEIVLQTTVLFDYATVEHLAAYIVHEHRQTLREALGRRDEPTQAPVADTAAAAIPSPPPVREARASRLASPAVESGSGIPYKRILLDGPGDIEGLVPRDAVLPEPGPNQVAVAIKAFSLNFGDLLCVRGLYPTMPPYPFTPGYDASGIVLAVGEAVDRVSVGDAVIVEAGEALGAHATAMIGEQENLTHKPATLSFEDACALPVVTITMIDAFHKARLQPGESILIQTAAGGTGLIAVQLAKHRGATIFATAGSEEKLRYLRDLGVDHCINYLESDFETEIARLTQGRGVDVVINTLSGDAIQKGLNSLAAGGRYIEIAMTALKSARSVDLSVLNNNQSFHSVDMRRLALEQPRLMQRYRQEMLSLYEQGAIRPTICRSFPFEAIRDAYQALADRGNIGKIVVTIPEARQIEQRSTALVSARTGRQVPAAAHEPIAIIGMSGRFARSESLDQFWEHLKAGSDLVSEVTRWRPDEARAGADDAAYCSRGSFIDSMDLFDPLFFRISPLEALYMDPQQRIFLEEAWKALEDAGYAGDGINGRACGVYVGCIDSQYRTLFIDEPPGQAFWGNAVSVIPARIAYYLDLHGPAAAVDTACSSSLVAIHLACQGLWLRETEMALAGGVFMQATPQFYQSSNRAGMLSPRGRCHSFDARADGFVPGEGVGVIVLKRLADAQRDHDSIQGVIIGSGINQDGSTNGITAPSSLSQERLECSVYDRFDIDPRSIQLVEAHGTGTELGDPIEYGALSRSFGRYTDERQFCAIGSVKSNIGHAATAAGIAGLLKLLLAVKNRQIPPSLHFEQGNPAIDFESTPFYVNTALTPWETRAGRPRRAAISSFGFSGTNAHLVIEEPPSLGRVAIERPGYLVVLSALSETQLRTQVQNLMAFIDGPVGPAMNDLSHTLLLGRRHLTHRLACVAHGRQELIDRLQQWLEKGKAKALYTARLPDGGAREQVALKTYANQAIQDRRASDDAADYLQMLTTVADLYVQGYQLDFPALFPADSARISLPTYPFARERYWIDGPTARERAITGRSGALHPLLHLNTSDLLQHSYRSRFSGTEFFLRDHRVSLDDGAGGVAPLSVLPAVAYLEMAVAALKQATPDRSGPAVIELFDVVWFRPIVITAERELGIVLLPHAEGGVDGRIGFEIHSEDEVHGQGHLRFVEEPVPGRIDLTQLRESMNSGRIEAADLYPRFERLGLHYGPAHRGIRSLRLGEQQLLAHLQLPEALRAEGQDYLLHPSMMDSGLQATIALIVDLDNPPARPALPYAVDRLRLYAPCTDEMYAWVRRSDASPHGERIARFDIDLCDAAGMPAVRIEGFSTRAAAQPPVPAPPDDDTFDESFYQQMIERVLNNDISAAEAGELEQ